MDRLSAELWRSVVTASWLTTSNGWSCAGRSDQAEKNLAIADGAKAINLNQQSVTYHAVPS